MMVTMVTMVMLMIAMPMMCVALVVFILRVTGDEKPTNVMNVELWWR